MRTYFVILSLVGCAAAHARAEEFGKWKELTNPFPSTSGGGVMIHNYDPVVKGEACTTDFYAEAPDGARFDGEVAFDAVPADGGTLCTNGRWKMKDGSGEGTTPFRVFIKDGVKRGDPL